MSELSQMNARILLVEDNPRALDLLKKRLARFGYQCVGEATSAAEAMSILDERQFDIIVADMRLEKEDGGFTVIDEVVRRGLSSVVIVYTANETWIDCRKALHKRACWDYISKSMEGDPIAEVHKSIQDAIVYFNRWGNINDEKWIENNNIQLLEAYAGKYIAVINRSVIEVADTMDEIKKRIDERKLPVFLTVIRKMDPGLLHEAPLVNYIEMQENDVLEFKSSLHVDKQMDSTKPCLKSIAAFLNGQGGTLVIGVNKLKDKDGRGFIVTGLDYDYAALKNRGNRDDFENHLRDLVANGASKVVASSEFIKIRFEDVEGKDVCIVDVKKASSPVFIGKQREFFIRTGGSTRSLNMEEFSKFMSERQSKSL